jgi:hypothetical protein
VQEIGAKVVITNQLTELLETTIIKGELLDTLQIEILEKLVIWFDNGMNVQDRMVCKKIGDLMVQLIDKM